MKGRTISEADGVKKLKIDDLYDVFKKVKGTPKFWQAAGTCCWCMAGGFSRSSPSPGFIGRHQGEGNGPWNGEGAVIPRTGKNYLQLPKNSVCHGR